MRRAWKEGRITPTVHSSSESKKEIVLRGLLEDELCGVPVEKKVVRCNGRRFIPDIIVAGEVIVEFFGGFWHADPFRFNPDDIVHHRKTAGQIWDSDWDRFSALQDAGYGVLVIWEDDWDRMGGGELRFAVTAVLDGEMPDAYFPTLRYGEARMAGEDKKPWD